MNITKSSLLGIPDVADDLVRDQRFLAALTAENSVSASITASVDDYNLPTLRSAVALLISANGNYNLNGLATGRKGRLLWLVNTSASNTITLVNAASSSRPENQFAINSNITLQPKQAAQLWYDGASKVWRCLSTTPTGLYSGYNSSLSTSYLVTALDNNKIFDCDVSSATLVITLPSAVALPAGFTITVRVSANVTTGVLNSVTITPNALDGINGPYYGQNAVLGQSLNLQRTSEIITLVATGVSGGAKGQGWIVTNYYTPDAGKNVIYNPSGIVQQRPAGTINTSGTYVYSSQDRWKCSLTAGTSVSGTAGVAGLGVKIGNQFGMGIKAITTTGTGGVAIFRQFIESKDASYLLYRTCSFAAQVRHDVGSNVTFAVNIYYASAGTDNFGSPAGSSMTLIAGTTFSIASGAWTAITYPSFPMGANASAGICVEITAAIGTVANKNVYLTDVQLAPGALCYPLVERSYQEELARCQRYCYVVNGTVTGAVPAVNGVGTTAPTTGECHFVFPVTMRQAPSYSFVGTIGNVNMTTATLAHVLTNSSSNNITREIGHVVCTATGATFTSNQPFELRWSGSSASDAFVWDADF